MSGWSAAIDSGSKFLTGIRERFFPTKTPEEKERDRVEKEKRQRHEDAVARRKAMKDANEGKTSRLEDYINRD